MTTCDFVGTTFSVRSGFTHAPIETTWRPLSTKPLLVSDKLAGELPCVAELIRRGVAFTAWHGCPMLRATGVPGGGDVKKLLAGVALEFASEAMQELVRLSVGDDDGGGTAPGLDPVFRRRDELDEAIVVPEPVDAREPVDDDEVETEVKVKPAADPLREWDDLPLCAFWGNGDSQTTKQHWTATADIAIAFQPLSCNVEVGKRLNRSVSMVLQHFGHGDDCFTLFTGLGLEIDVEKLRAFPSEYRRLFSTAKTWFSKGSAKDRFKARQAGLYVFARNQDTADHALRIALRVIDLSLESWLFSCERATLPPLSPKALSLSVSSSSELALAVQRRPQALTLSCGTQAVSVDALDHRTDLLNLRLLVLIGCRDVPCARVLALMSRLKKLVVCWHAVDVPAAVELARAFPERTCLLSPFNADKMSLRRELLAKGFDENTAHTLIGTHLSTVPLRRSAIIFSEGSSFDE
jgi:hypothetical protein